MEQNTDQDSGTLFNPQALRKMRRQIIIRVISGVLIVMVLGAGSWLAVTFIAGLKHDHEAHAEEPEPETTPPFVQ